MYSWWSWWSWWTLWIAIQLLLGIGVLASYGCYSNRLALVNKVWGCFAPGTCSFVFWVISMVLTVCSYIFLWVMLHYETVNRKVFKSDTDIGVYLIVAGVCNIVFLVSAMLWAPIVVYCTERSERFGRAIVWVTACSTVGFLVVVFSTVRPGVGLGLCMKVASVILVFHHLVLDAVIWGWTFTPSIN